MKQKNKNEGEEGTEDAHDRQLNPFEAVYVDDPTGLSLAA